MLSRLADALRARARLFAVRQVMQGGLDFEVEECSDGGRGRRLHQIHQMRMDGVAILLEETSGAVRDGTGVVFDREHVTGGARGFQMFVLDQMNFFCEATVTAARDSTFLVQARQNPVCKDKVFSASGLGSQKKCHQAHFGFDYLDVQRSARHRADCQ